MKAPYCSTIAGMQEISHGSESVDSVYCDGSIAFFRCWQLAQLQDGFWCYCTAVLHSAGGAFHPQEGLGEAQKAETGMFRAQWDRIMRKSKELSMCSLAKCTTKGQGEGVLLRDVRHPLVWYMKIQYQQRHEFKKGKFRRNVRQISFLILSSIRLKWFPKKIRETWRLFKSGWAKHLENAEKKNCFTRDRDWIF